MNTNIRGIFLPTQRIGAKSMLPAGRGRIVNIAYNIRQGACITFTQALATEWGPSGITVNAIASRSIKPSRRSSSHPIPRC